MSAAGLCPCSLGSGSQLPCPPGRSLTLLLSSRLHGCSVVAADLFPGEACERAGRLGALHSPVMLLPGSLVFNRSAEPPCRRLPCNRAVRATAQACLGKTWVSLCPGNTTAGLRGERGRSGRRKVGLRMVWTTCGQRAAWVERSLPLWEPSAGWSIPSRRLALPWVHEDGASRPVVQQPCFLPQSFLIDGFLGIPDSHGVMRGEQRGGGAGLGPGLGGARAGVPGEKCLAPGGQSGRRPFCPHPGSRQEPDGRTVRRGPVSCPPKFSRQDGG
ncbi:PREDICTED: uncharacterized protein LOC108523139 isoform X1 [Rhinopithecus bieti]|uniref:uncharacterized protein LOC108523139 isoform X1 n=1 Tax=Rhinopithecus bieti TaxID=61621 RepID=UPI00083BF1B9|nr:PREDICTED: uncharacterized protein LOC108523139 isoform X1 [Rhinopithecus bieti]